MVWHRLKYARPRKQSQRKGGSSEPLFLLEKSLVEEQITSLLASVAGGRRYWSRAPQTPPQRPYAVLSRVSGVRGYHNQGDDGLVASRVQIDIYADTYQSAHTTAEAVISTLSGYRGGTIQAVFIDSQRDLSGIESGDPNELFRVSIDLIVHHTES